MTENEAIKELETSIDLAKMCTQNYERKNEIQGYGIAIKALEEVQQYRAIGTVEECRAAVKSRRRRNRITRETDTQTDSLYTIRGFALPAVSITRLIMIDMIIARIAGSALIGGMKYE